MYPIKLSPALKDYLWGGTRLKTEYGIKTELDPVAEAWVLSAHDDGASTAVNGEFAGLTLSEIIKKTNGEVLGVKAGEFEFFPILVKLIDAKGNLSIQVHPSDEYALKNEGQYCKTEMWYVVDCDKDAYLYYGFNREVTKQEFKTRIEQNTLLEVLNKVPVKKGDCFFIESGTLHAICEGILIAEIQQNSNLTYRIYDYGRVGADGKERELHIDKALKVTTTTPPTVPYGKPQNNTLAKCKYFTAEKLEVDGVETITVGDDSFKHILCLEGEVVIGDLNVTKGESVFLPARLGDIKISGKASLIISKV